MTSAVNPGFERQQRGRQSRRRRCGPMTPLRRERGRLGERLALDEAGDQARERHRVAADVEDAAAAQRWVEQPPLGIARHAEAKSARTCRMLPIDALAAAARSARAISGWQRYMNASIRKTPFLRAASITRSRRSRRRSSSASRTARACPPRSPPSPAPRATGAASRCRPRRPPRRRAARQIDGADAGMRERSAKPRALSGDEPTTLTIWQRSECVSALREVRRRCRRCR